MSAKEAKAGGSSRRKGSRRADISHAGAYRLLKKGASSQVDNPRISKQAVEAAVDNLEEDLESIGEQVSKLLKLMKRSTVTPKVLKAACKNVGLVSSICDARGVRSTRTDRSALSTPGLVRQLKLTIGKNKQISEAGRHKLLAIAESHIKHQGKVAGCSAKNARRKTILAKDLHCSLV